jgi:hypothetical protein
MLYGRYYHTLLRELRSTCSTREEEVGETAFGGVQYVSYRYCMFVQGIFSEWAYLVRVFIVLEYVAYLNVCMV